MKRILDESPCRASMKNSGNKGMIKRKGKLKRTPGEALQWLDEALKWYNWNNLELRKEKWTNEIKNYDESPEKGINHLDETRIRITLCLAFTHLDWWQATDFCILLILVERIKIDMAQTWEGLRRTTGRIGKNEWIYMITKEENSWTNHRKNWNERRKDKETPGRIRKWTMILERI